MRVAVISSEAVPYSKTGGLADVAGALPKALKRAGADSVLITPCYLQTKGEFIWSTAIEDLWLEWRGRSYRAKAFYSEANGSPTFLIDAPEFFHRDSIYGFTEDYERFAFFNHAALVLLKRVGKKIDIVHLNDWHCGFAAVKLAHLRFWDVFWKDTRTVFSVHNLAYQGGFGSGELWDLGFGSRFEQDHFAFEGYASAMKAGLSASDMLSTVSPTYGVEIQRSENGYGLDWLLRARSSRLSGITNGVDYEVWNPETDELLAANYSWQDLSGKRTCKRELLDQFSLPVDLDTPVFGTVSRLTSQKGIELIQQVAGEIINLGAYFIALGSGDRSYEDFFQRLRNAAPGQVGFFRGYNEDLAHTIEAGADLFLMPSRFEPCGLNQMYSLRYGTVPIVRAVGGLHDTIHNFDRVSGQGNGFKFGPFSAGPFLEKIYEAVFAFAEPETWRAIQVNGMKEDHSWENAAQKYIGLYKYTLQL
ncbi:MAG: glycogen synthase [Acidobacteria bacterium]|nr:MAG: glycogen synthase [Acidobacteriota bacterium]REK01263.1 MAG: glycogen synthase [Acidobacteriota bacterium]REK14219.1 MAG: glycogen synthase [Acidobacteriota bacterium]REK44934.1 MAG: glycogen synthase [Acidobacteriota bacterium]